MKFVYGYKTKGNETREGVISASSRDEAFRELKKKGVKPFRVDLAPGFANRLCSIGKRTYAILVLCVLCLALVAVVIRAKRETSLAANGPVPRHQIYGEPALMDDLERSGYARVFAHPGDRFLARYAQPGRLVPNGTKAEQAAAAEALAGLMKNPPALFAEGDAQTGPFAASREIRELKQIVLWMRDELRRYLANGVGTPARYVRRLAERQEREAMIYYGAKHDLENESDPEKWDRINASLRNAGLMTITPKLPEADRRN